MVATKTHECAHPCLQHIPDLRGCYGSKPSIRGEAGRQGSRETGRLAGGRAVDGRADGQAGGQAGLITHGLIGSAQCNNNIRHVMA